MSENSPNAWAVVVTMGDPVSHLGHKTSFGVFTSREEADKWVTNTYDDVPYIIDVVPLNQPFYPEDKEDINKEKK